MHPSGRLQIRGFIKSKQIDQIRIVTFDKHQEIDVFSTDSKKFDVEELVENERVVLEVRLQAIDYYGLKLRKFWISQILFQKKVMNTLENLINVTETKLLPN